jgi:hypothetical protein
MSLPNLLLQRALFSGWLVFVAVHACNLEARHHTLLPLRAQYPVVLQLHNIESFSHFRYSKRVDGETLLLEISRVGKESFTFQLFDVHQRGASYFMDHGRVDHLQFYTDFSVTISHEYQLDEKSICTQKVSDHNKRFVHTVICVRICVYVQEKLYSYVEHVIFVQIDLR